MSRLDRITADESMCHGKPVNRGLRYPIQRLLELMASTGKRNSFIAAAFALAGIASCSGESLPADTVSSEMVLGERPSISIDSSGGWIWLVGSGIGGGDELFEGRFKLDESSCLILDQGMSQTTVVILPKGSRVDPSASTIEVAGYPVADLGSKVELGGGVQFRDDVLSAGEVLPESECLGDRFLWVSLG